MTDLVEYIASLIEFALHLVLSCGPLVLIGAIVAVAVRKQGQAVRGSGDYIDVRHGAGPNMTAANGNVMTIKGDRNGQAALVELPAALTPHLIPQFLDAVIQWAGASGRNLVLIRGDCSCVDEVGLALRYRRYELTWIGDGPFRQNGWLAVPHWA